MHFPQPYYLSRVHWQSYCISCYAVADYWFYIETPKLKLFCINTGLIICVCAHTVVTWHSMCEPIHYMREMHPSSSRGACLVSVNISLIALGSHQHKDLMNERSSSGINNTTKDVGRRQKTHGCLYTLICHHNAHTNSSNYMALGFSHTWNTLLSPQTDGSVNTLTISKECISQLWWEDAAVLKGQRPTVPAQA